MTNMLSKANPATNFHSAYSPKEVAVAVRRQERAPTMLVAKSAGMRPYLPKHWKIRAEILKNIIPKHKKIRAGIFETITIFDRT